MSLQISKFRHLKERFHESAQSSPLQTLLASLVIIVLFVFLATSRRVNTVTQEVVEAPSVQSEKVLGTQIYVTGGDQGYSAGGMIALSSQDEPYVQIGGYNTSGDVTVDLYKADESSLLTYLTHDKDKKQTQSTPDTSTFTFVTTIKDNLTGSSYDGKRFDLPLDETGIWYLKVSVGSTVTHAYVVRSNIGAVVKEGNNEFIVWAQDFKTKRSVSDAQVKIYNLENGKNELWNSGFNQDGIAVGPLKSEADIALVTRGTDRAIVPINLQYLNVGYSYNQYQAKTSATKFFLFTDRPLYRPGDKLYFKSILRDDDDAKYSVPTGTARVRIYSDWGEENLVLDKNYALTSSGAIAGEWSLPKDAKVGYYRISVTSPNQSTETAYFTVQFFRKPEYSIDITASQTEFISGDDAQFTISGNYFSGQPLSGQKVNYTVYKSDYYEYTHLSERQYELSDDYRYGWWGSRQVSESSTVLDSKGNAVVSINTKFDQLTTKSQIYSVEASYDNGSGNVSLARKNIIVYSGEYGIYQKSNDWNYSVKPKETYTLPLALISRKGASVASRDLVVKIHRSNWVTEQKEGQKYPTYRQEKEDLPDIVSKTNSDGVANINFTPEKVGSYEVVVQGKDSRDNTIEKSFFVYVHEGDAPYYWSNQTASDLTINTDRTKYNPGENAEFAIYSQRPNQDVLLTMERGYTHRYQVVHVTGKKASVTLPIESSDMPNMYASVSTFSENTLLTNSMNVPVSTDSKKLSVRLTSDRKTYGPGDQVTVNVETQSSSGNPISAEVAVWSVDKALFELVDNTLGDIFKTFWSERYDSTQFTHSLQGILVSSAERGGGCFAEGTEVLMSDATTKKIETIEKGDMVLSKSDDGKGSTIASAVTDIHKTQVNGYFIINGTIRVTPNHRLWVNSLWREASQIETGDRLIDKDSNPVVVTSIEWIRGNFTVYNLTVDKYHTYFAGGVWVHNQKGDARNIFKDTAYWNPSVKTDANGRAQISFKLPDNLTTWVLAAVGANETTVVGQTKTELIVSKDVIVRPILPNIFRVGDEARISALVQNFTETDQVFDVEAAFDAGEVKNPIQTAVTLKSKESKQLYWDILPMSENEAAKVTFSARSVSAKSAKNNDSITTKIPVRTFGFAEVDGSTGEGDKTYTVALSDDINKDKTTVSISLAPTILGTLPSAMQYLVDYPYGCVEQTTSRFVPAVIAKANAALLKDALQGKNVDEMINKGLDRLASLQMIDGGWGWWSGGGSDNFITSYVLEYMLYAQRLGISVDSNMLSRAENFVKQEKANETLEQKVARHYSLSLFTKDKANNIKDFSSLNSDLLSMAVMLNVRNGDENPASNGLGVLLSKAKAEGDMLYWSGGTQHYFASTDGSTALAIRAIVEAKGDRSFAVKAARYLLRQRKNYYWSNSFATSQVVRSIVDLSKTGSEQNPNYTYSVQLDGVNIANGSVTSAQQIVKPILVPIDKVKKGASAVSITKSGEGQVYSTLLVNQYHTSKDSPAVEHGLSVTREYVNAKGPEYNIAVGDVVNVNITVDGLTENNYYGVIEDELPAGFIPVNEAFKNQQLQTDQNAYYSYYGVSDREYSLTGAVLSLYQIAKGKQTYTYKAIAVNGGTYWAPPARASLMYSPEIHGRSSVEKIIIEDESRTDPSKAIAQKFADIASGKRSPLIPALFIFLGVLLVVFVIVRHKKVTVLSIKEWIKSKLKRPNKPSSSSPTTTVVTIPEPTTSSNETTTD